MTYGFVLLTAGSLLAYSGYTNHSIADVLKGLGNSQAGGAGSGFVALLTGAGNAVKPGSGGEGKGVAPKSHAKAVAAMVAAATSIVGKPYLWGGGHSAWRSEGYDCSGAVSYVLHAGGLLESPMTSGELMGYGDPGKGRWVTIYANPNHTFMKIGGTWFGTGSDKESNRGGPAWGNHDPELSAYTVRHPKGF